MKFRKLDLPTRQQQLAAEYGDIDTLATPEIVWVDDCIENAIGVMAIVCNDAEQRRATAICMLSSDQVAALLYLDSGRLPEADEVFPLALTAHRKAQGGRGSGYDIACSTYGGLGLLHGGVTPTWQPLSLDKAPNLRLLHAPRAVSTVEAITPWQAWRQQHPEAWRNFLEQSNACVQAMAQCGEEPTFTKLWRQVAEEGRRLGQAMGIWDPRNEAFRQGDIPAGQGKALGAGNELFGVLCAKDHSDRVGPAQKGLQWN